MGLIQGCENPHRAHGFLLSAALAFILIVGLNPPATHVLLAEEANSGPGTASGAGVTLFAERVRPVLLAHCLMCHNKELKQAGLDITTRESLLKGGDNGPVVVPGNAAASLLYKKVRHEHEPGMPYKMAKLPEEVVAQIGEWINSGAPYDGPLELRNNVARVKLPSSDHWAYQPPNRPAIPHFKMTGKGNVKPRLQGARAPRWSGRSAHAGRTRDGEGVPPLVTDGLQGNPIDAFLGAEQEKRGLKPLAPADKRTLLRRVSLDLIGLPPTAEQVRAFLNDSSKAAYDKVVDSLLASPRYGERWGRHWMDVWRYSDWYGRRNVNQVFNSQRHLWRWRDWIIESLNQDKGYDRMVLEMLAGDEVAPSDPETLRATGYLARNYVYDRQLWLQDTVDHAAMAFLGITLKCARCHDHKYDPISQQDYYRVRAFFEPYDVRIDPLPGNTDPEEHGVARVFDANLDAVTYRLIRGDEKNPDKDNPLSPGVPGVLNRNPIEIQPVQLALEAHYPASKTFFQQDLVDEAKKDVERAEIAMERARKALDRAQKRAAQVSSSSSSGEASSRHLSDSAAETPFDKEIGPLFQRSCFPCHDSTNKQSGLDLTSETAILKGANSSGMVVIPGNSHESPLVHYLRGERKPRMPLDATPITEAQLGVIQRWIDQLPEEEPLKALKQAERRAALAEKELAWARANLPAVEARILAERAKNADPPDSNAQAFAEAAHRAERQANLIKAESKLAQAQQVLAEALKAPDADESNARKRIAEARKQVESAQKMLSQSLEGHTPLGKSYPATSSGRRLALARWIASRDNPLTARVAINHIWLRHFGQPLVQTVSNFGVSGRPPTHPALLDWLACELVERNWSMKSIHRLIVTSDAYRRRSSTADPRDPNRAIDPENHYLWRMNPRRMEAEIVRDSLLYVAGELDTTMGGPEIEENRGEESRRRSVYLRHAPDSQVRFLMAFDAADPNECYQRTESIVPHQALALANSSLSFTQARRLARRLAQQATNRGDGAFVSGAFEEILGRPPSKPELARGAEFLRQQANLLRDPAKLTAIRLVSVEELASASDANLRAREDLVHVLLNHNDFLTIR